MEEKLFIKDIFKKLFQYKFSIAFIVLGATGFLITLSFLLPKTYRSEFEINIYSRYFKNGAISEVVPGVSSLKEMTDTIDSMIKEVMNDEFIDEIAIEYKFYSDLRPSVDLKNNYEKYSRAKERKSLRKRFKYYSTGIQSYKLLFTDKSPLVALEVTKKVLEKIKSSFIKKRISNIELVRKSLLQKLESIVRQA